MAIRRVGIGVVGLILCLVVFASFFHSVEFWTYVFQNSLVGKAVAVAMEILYVTSVLFIMSARKWGKKPHKSIYYLLVYGSAMVVIANLWAGYSSMTDFWSMFWGVFGGVVIPGGVPLLDRALASLIIQSKEAEEAELQEAIDKLGRKVEKMEKENQLRKREEEAKFEKWKHEESLKNLREVQQQVYNEEKQYDIQKVKDDWEIEKDNRESDKALQTDVNKILQEAKAKKYKDMAKRGDNPFAPAPPETTTPSPTTTPRKPYVKRAESDEASDKVTRLPDLSKLSPEERKAYHTGKRTMKKTGEIPSRSFFERLEGLNTGQAKRVYEVLKAEKESENPSDNQEVSVQ